MATVTFKGSNEDLRRIIGDVVSVLAGKLPDRNNLGRSVWVALGFAALSDIKDAYVVKARGGTDAMGIRWPPLQPKTIANRRVGRNQTSELIKTRERIRKRETKKALARYRLSLPEGEAQRRAKIVGGLKATKETGKTKVETLGNRNVEILRDTGVMLNSLTPGQISDGAYGKPRGEGADEQIFETNPGEVTIGTNVIYASTHQHGDDSRNIPARPFLPSEEYPVPQVWWESWARTANRAIVSVIARSVQRRAQGGSP